MIRILRDIKTFLYFSVDNVNIVFFYNGNGNQNLRGNSVDIICVKESKYLEIWHSTAFSSIAGSVDVKHVYVLEDFEPFYAYLQDITLTNRNPGFNDSDFDKEERMKLVTRWFTRISKIDRLLE